MKSVDTAIAILAFFLAAALLFFMHISYGSRLNPRIKKASGPAGAGKASTENTRACIDYDIYQMALKEKLICVLTAGALIFAAGYVFYRSIVISLLLVPTALLYPGIRTKDIVRRRKTELNLQFREALYSISSSLSAGKSIETAFRDAHKELSIQYPDGEAYILAELEIINRKIDMNETIEEALADFAERSHLEDIINFADVFAVCKRTGGNLVQAVKNTAEIISEKIDIKQEINILLAEKRLEHKILNLMPVLIVLLLSTSAEEFMAPVFKEPLGRAAMTLSLMLFALSYYISRKIMDIEV